MIHCNKFFNNLVLTCTAVFAYRKLTDYQSEAGDDDEVEEDKGQLAQLDDATLRERIATMGKGKICTNFTVKHVGSIAFQHVFPYFLLVYMCFIHI